MVLSNFRRIFLKSEESHPHASQDSEIRLLTIPGKPRKELPSHRTLDLICRYMLELAFGPLDVFDLFYREVDNAFWQFDLLFVRSDLALFQDPRYSIAGRH